MSVLSIDGWDIQIADIDFLLQKEIDGTPSMLIHLRSGETNCCEFAGIVEREKAWETIRKTFMKDDFYECPQIFFRREAVVAASIGENRQDGPYIQMAFRGGMLLRRPFADKKIRDEDFAMLNQLLLNHPHQLH